VIIAALSKVKDITLITDINQQSKHFTDAISTIKSTMEKLHAYIVKSNAEYERRLKESTTSAGRRSSITDPK
jgi:hypothetical protein